MSGAELPNPSPHQEPESSPIPPDPLLYSGSFLDPDRPKTQQSEQSPYTPFPPGTVIAAVPISMVAPEDISSSAPKAATRRSAEEMAKRPNWLPNDWKIELKVRSSGATAGLIDRYYIEPSGERKFRSKNEVLHFLETGSKRKKSSNFEVDIGTLESRRLISGIIHPPNANAESPKKTPQKS
ncbi:hypothetical protein ACJIZ3_012153 [Penstemon smallii]|uniref:MBD domain-containing protein n=1 Tax=Penstemon smallii TaxID=265156 RepID=A0ABD3UMS1_9LAMI